MLLLRKSHPASVETLSTYTAKSIQPDSYYSLFIINVMVNLLINCFHFFIFLNVPGITIEFPLENWL